MIEFQRRLYAWQFPDDHTVPALSTRGPRRTCASSKFLMFEPRSHQHGIGSLLEVTAVAFRYALCLDRILILSPIAQENTFMKWRHPGCQGNTFECYFERVTGCDIDFKSINVSRFSQTGEGFDLYPLKHEKLLYLKGFPTGGKCTLCNDPWPSDHPFFDGLFISGLSDPDTITEYDQSHPVDIKEISAQLYIDFYFNVFQSSIKLPWASQFLRFIMRPRKWFSQSIEQIIQYTMQSPIEYINSSVGFPIEYVSLHVRYGMKLVEVKVVEPLNKYMLFIMNKYPHCKDVFVSTETEAVIEALIYAYPSIRFHFLSYPRMEYLDLGLKIREIYEQQDYVSEFLYSMANLYVVL